MDKNLPEMLVCPVTNERKLKVLPEEVGNG